MWYKGIWLKEAFQKFLQAKERCGIIRMKGEI
jgi:hypothetical protein